MVKKKTISSLVNKVNDISLKLESEQSAGLIYTEEMIPQFFSDFIEIKFGNKRGCQKAAADHFGVSKQFINNILGGNRMPSSDMLKQMGLKYREIAFYELTNKSSQKPEDGEK